MDELERIAALGWRATDAARLGEWLLRAAGGFTGRANSALPVGDPGRPAVEAIRAVQDWYADRGLPAQFQVPLPLAVDLDERLAADGWSAGVPVEVLVADVPNLMDAPARVDLPVVQVDPTPDDAWVSAYHYRGGTLPAHAVRVLANGDGLGFASVRAGDEVLAIGRGSVNDGWLGVTAVEVEPGARRRGLGAHLLRGLVAWGARRGARSSYLQVSEDNEPALALYARLGFVPHHRYHYRTH